MISCLIRMFNILIFFDMVVKQVNLYPDRGFTSNIGVCKKLKKRYKLVKHIILIICHVK